jgi:hypothetical protein
MKNLAGKNLLCKGTLFRNKLFDQMPSKWSEGENFKFVDLMKFTQICMFLDLGLDSQAIYAGMKDMNADIARKRSYYPLSGR